MFPGARFDKTLVHNMLGGKNRSPHCSPAFVSFPSHCGFGLRSPVNTTGPVSAWEPEMNSFRDFAFQKWHARIHEMEGIANAQMGYSNRVPILIIRALSDLAGGQKGINREERNSSVVSK